MHSVDKRIRNQLTNGFGHGSSPAGNICYQQLTACFREEVYRTWETDAELAEPCHKKRRRQPSLRPRWCYRAYDLGADPRTARFLKRNQVAEENEKGKEKEQV